MRIYTFTAFTAATEPVRSPQFLKIFSTRTNLSVVAITDHDTLRGTAEAADLAPRYGLEVVPGCEVSTAEGHLLALFIQRPVRPGRSLIETAQAVADQGGLCIAAHPMARGVNSLSFEAIRLALQDPRAARALVALKCSTAAWYIRAATRWRLPGRPCCRWHRWGTATHTSCR